MNKYLGLFIDDDQKNFESIKRLFSLKNIQLLPYENLPQDINEIYQKVIDLLWISYNNFQINLEEVLQSY